MRQRVKIAALSLSVLLLVIVLMLPGWLLSLGRVKGKILEAAESRLKASCSYTEVDWDWLPIPHLVLYGVEVKARSFSLHSSAIEVFPDWLGIIRGHNSISGLSLLRPRLLILTLEGAKGESIRLPSWLEISDGSLELAKGITFPFLPFHNKRPSLQNIYGLVRLGKDRITGTLKVQTEVASLIDLKLDYQPSSQDYSANIKVKDLDLAGLYFKNVTTRPQFPRQGFISFQAKVEGTGLYEATGVISAYSNCFVSEGLKRSAIFSCGSLATSFEYHRDFLQVNVDSLEFEQPRLSLQGVIKLLDLQGNQRLQMDLLGWNIDIGALRKGVMALFSHEKKVRKVCKIVRDGLAKHITFRFDAPPTKLKSLSDMYIAGEVEGARIYVPDESLMIDWISAPFEIVQGVLYAKNARVRLRDMAGRDGSIVLGLSKGEEQLKLDIRISAPARDVKWAMLKFNKDKLLHQELKRVSDLRGRLDLRLKVGDHKKHKHVYALIDKVNVVGFYKTLDATVSVKGGNITYFRDVLTFKGVRGSVGPNRLHKLSGKVSWRDHIVDIRMDSAQGTLNGSALLSLASKIKGLSSLIRRYEVKAKGQLELLRLKGHLNLREPRSMEYLLALSPQRLSVSTNALPDSVLIKTGSVMLTNERINARDLKIKMGQDWYDLYLSMRHRWFKEWQGRLKFSGKVTGVLWRWLEKRGVHLDEFTPRPPFYARQFVADFVRDGPDRFFGGLAWPRLGVELNVEAFHSKGLIDIRHLLLKYKGQKRCLISLLLRDFYPLSFVFSLKGSLESKVLNEILLNNQLLSGSISGDMLLSFSEDRSLSSGMLKGGRWDVKGKLKASGVNWLWSKRVPLSFEYFDCSIKGNKGGFDTTLILNGKRLTGRGTLRVGSNQLFLDGEIAGGFLDKRTLDLLEGNSSSGTTDTGAANRRQETVSRGEARQGDKEETDRSGEEKHPSIKAVKESVTVNATFKLKGIEVAIPAASSQARAQHHNVDLNEVYGRLLFRNDTVELISLHSPDMCGLNTSYLKDKGQHGERTFLRVWTDRDKGPGEKGRQVRFETVLPCLGIDQDLVAGPFSINLEIEGGKTLLPAKGKVVIKAHNGNLKKFVILSKIFSVVNVIDLFSLNTALLEGTSPYKKLLIAGDIKGYKLVLKKAYINGPGLNFFGTGDIDFKDHDLNLIIFLQPLKTVDRIITSVPIIGGIIGGKNHSLFAVPIKVSGDWSNPDVDTLQTKTVTDLFKKLILNILTAPFPKKND